MCKGPGARPCLVWWKSSEEACVAAAEYEGGEREEVRAGRGWGRSCRALWVTGRIWAFTERDLGALEGCVCRVGHNLTWCSQALSGDCCGKDKLGG